MSPDNASRHDERNAGTAGLWWSIVRLATLALFVAGPMTLLARQHWLADILANLRVQQMIGIGGILIATLSRRRWKHAALVTLLLPIHLPWFLLPPARAEHATVPAEVSITAVNVYVRNHADDKISRELIKLDSDLIAVFEVNERLFERLKRDLQHSHPHTAGRPAVNPFGVALFSKRPLRDVRVIDTDHTGGSIAASVIVEDTEHLVVAVHPMSPIPKDGPGRRSQHLGFVHEVITKWRSEHNNGHVVAIGDFNLTPWTPLFHDYVDMTNLKHVAAGSGIEPSWYAWPFFPFGLVLDHCLISDNLQWVSSKYGPSVNSDHRPLTVKLRRKTN